GVLWTDREVGWTMPAGRGHRRWAMPTLLTSAEERDQVGHLLGVDVLLEAFGHEGLAGRAKFIDLGAEEDVLDALGAAELHVGRGRLGEESGVDLAAVGGGGEDDVIGLDGLVGVEDIGQERVGGPAGDAGEVRPDAMALPLELVAGLAVPDEDG